MEDTRVYMEVSFFLTNRPYDKLIMVLWNICISFACCEPDFFHKGYNSKSIKVDIFLASILHFHSILPKLSILKKKKKNQTTFKNPTHKDEVKCEIQFVHTDICHFRGWRLSTSLKEQVCFQ